MVLTEKVGTYPHIVEGSVLALAAKNQQTIPTKGINLST